jgi:RecA-family ATPase
MHMQNIIMTALSQEPSQNPMYKFMVHDPALAPVNLPEFVIEGMAAKGRVTVIAGPPGSGKSFLVQYLLQAKSNPILKVNRERAYYLTGADASEDDIRIRARQLEYAGHGNLFTTYLDDPDILTLASNAEFMQALTLHLIQHRADVVVFDTVRDYYDGDSKEAMIANKVMVEFRKLAERANVAVMLITHTRKAAAGKPDIKIEDVADSRIFTSKADFVFGLQHEYRDDETTLVQIINLKTRGARPLPRIRYLVKDVNQMVYFEKTDQLFSWESEVRDKQLEIQFRNDKIRKLRDEGSSVEDIAKEVGLSRQTIHKILKTP